MAIIIEGGQWLLSDEVAEQMVSRGFIIQCKAEHADIKEQDKPIYHKSPTAPDWFGFSTIRTVIRTEEIHLKDIDQLENPHVNHNIFEDQ